MNEQLIKQMESVLSSKEVVPKVKAGTGGGLAAMILGAVVTGITTGDWKSGLIMAAALSLPVLGQFALAWIWVDPRMEVLKRVLEEMKKNGQ